VICENQVAVNIVIVHLYSKISEFEFGIDASSESSVSSAFVTKNRYE